VRYGSPFICVMQEKPIDRVFLLQPRLPFSPSPLGLALGNSRARQLLSRVQAIAGFGFPPDCRLRLLNGTNNLSGASEKLTRSPGERPPSHRVAPANQGTKGRQKTCFARIASLSLVFSANTPRRAPHRTGPSTLAFPRYERELERERNWRT
jgi:hypothetical protein